MRKIVVLAAAAVLALITAAPAAQAAPDGTLTPVSTTVKAGERATFTYTTPRPHQTNWIGLYADPGNGPVDQKYVGPSLTWVYIPNAAGTASLDTAGLEPGDYVAYALAQDGYEWLARPARLRIVSNEPLRLVTERIPLRNARAKSAYAATIAGLARGDTEGLSFAKIAGPAWVNVAADGRVTGTPPASASAKTVRIGVTASNGAGQSRTAELTIDVRPPGGPLVPELKALSWNLWHGGSQVNHGRDKQLKFLLDHDIDVVGLQETSGTAAKALGEALGWDYHQSSGSVGVISRYPITARTAPNGLPVVGTRVDLGGRQLSLWSAHLGYTPYGPYDACFGKMTVEQLLAQEARSGRTAQVEGVVRAMAGDLEAAGGGTPVLLTGDFNAPSHLDWTRETARCGYAHVPWPTSVLPEQAGLRDSFRVAHPDPVAEPGVTWSPIYPVFTGGYGHDGHKGEPEPQDRIDFIHFKGDLEVVSSRTVVTGTPAPVPGHRDNEWTSDHAAVLTVFRAG
ncbi:endonuclease/exonuclease/phosphatase family protein [Nonomuraea sp. NPDC050663]|uniref:endonuclease/exonuclease/phosphatase family protein n=1 Tax=Nonomuraea sp. NPDC050663 TaxID=3364370 RepID=UPI0037AF0D61